MDLWRDLPKSRLRKSFLLRITVRTGHYLVQVNDRCKKRTLELEVVKLICKINSAFRYMIFILLILSLRTSLAINYRKLALSPNYIVFLLMSNVSNTFVLFSFLIDKCSGRQKVLKTSLILLA